MCFSPSTHSRFARHVLILKLGDLLRDGIPAADLIRPLLAASHTDPSAAGAGGMNCRSADIRHRKILHLARLRIEPRDLVGHAEVRYPDVAGPWSGAALKGMRLGAGMSYSTYTMFKASLLVGRMVSL